MRTAPLLVFVVTAALTVAAAGPLVAATATDDPPRKSGALLRWLRDGTWRDTWTPEPRIHDSLGPHGGRVRTWYSPTLVEDLAAGAKTFRRGAAMVKALYGSGSTKPRGWAVMVKVKDGRSRRNWFFFESETASVSDVIRGRGISGCADCHSGGRDFLLSKFRP